MYVEIYVAMWVCIVVNNYNYYSEIIYTHFETTPAAVITLRPFDCLGPYVDLNLLALAAVSSIAIYV